MPQRFSSFSVTGAGAVSMMVGSLPIEVNALMRARGFAADRLAESSLPSRTAAAPSTMPLELPPVCTCSMASTCGYFCRATASKPACPKPDEGGLELGERLERRVGPHDIRRDREHFAEHIPHRNDGALK